MAYDEMLAERVRGCLRDMAASTGKNTAAGKNTVAEKKMFGGLVFMTDGHLTVGVYGDGLIARIGAADMAEAVAEPGVRAFDMAGRPMRGIVIVSPDALGNGGLSRWIARARGHAARLPPK